MKQMKLTLLVGREIKIGIVSILLSLILALIPYLPVVAQETGTITITMTGVEEISITVSPTSWSLGEGGIVSPNTLYLTDTTWFTLTVGGNCGVNTFIVGEDAVCVGYPEYSWALSDNENNDERIYVLMFKVYDDVRGYLRIPKESPGEAFYPTSLGPTDSKQFGLKLLTPLADFTKDGVGYFSVGATMQTTITISAVAA